MLESLFTKVAILNVCIFIKKRLQHSRFPVNTAKYFYTTSLYDCTFHEILCDDRFFEHLWVWNWHFSNLFSYCFVFLHNSIKISIPWLIRTSFHTKIVTHYNVGCTAILIEPLKFRNNSRITVTSPSNLLQKLWILYFVIIFSLEAVLQGVAKNKPAKSMQKFRRHWSMRQHKNSEEKTTFIDTNCKDRFKL